MAWWGAMVICLERGADLHMAQLMPLPLTVSCFSKIQIGFTFLVPAHPGNPEQRVVKRVCVWLVALLILMVDWCRIFVANFVLQNCLWRNCTLGLMLSLSSD